MECFNQEVTDDKCVKEVPDDPEDKGYKCNCEDTLEGDDCGLNTSEYTIYQGFQSVHSIHAINLLTTGLFTINTMRTD